MITADTITDETLSRLRERYPVEDWDLLVVGLLRAGFEFAVDSAEVCHEAECTHDNVESHLNWTEGRRAFEEHCAEILNSRAGGG